jgi:3-oxo-5alpha-steroid 4-dehydrogenase
MTPIVVDDPDSVQWGRIADVVVVGFGGAGACAALQAREEGADVLLIDRFGGGGTTKYSGGVIYAGATRFQREAGFEDSIDNLEAYLKMEVGDAVRPETLRRFCEGSAADVEWLIGHGVRYDSSAYLEKVTFPPEGKYLYYSGNEKTPSFAARARPVPRGHRAVGRGFGGRHYIEALRKALDRERVPLLLHTKVTQLVTDINGDVIGVEVFALTDRKCDAHQAMYETGSPYVPHNIERALTTGAGLKDMEWRDGCRMLIRALGGVVLSTGGFAYDPELIGRHDPGFVRHYRVSHPLATLGNDGAGAKLGMSVGGATGRMQSLYIARNIAPPEALLDGILVNRNGERFVAEDAYTAVVGGAINRQPDGAAWMIVPAASFRKSISEVMTCGWQRFKYFGMPMLANYVLGGTKRGGTAEKLARKLGIEAARLGATITQHDADLAAGRPDRAGKMDNLRASLGRGPFYAINMSMENRHALTKFMTLGGLTVDEDTGAVTRPDGRPVPGLYAAGMAAVGLHSNGYISGISLADGVFSGRRAGRSAATTAASATDDKIAASA